ncbi:OmpP1/FadL family transporter [Mesorhizobium sp. RMAD-H1]|uniref:OmpP1/FadL family transporter n=1 Tax=Mesorhizobium sp. RMAD-H1 TaxID=2587065 RepID=UPI00161C7DE1|nr:OmpP1/FadL family transporter [Mesorhizobium sp. RMAD-H1]MBB2973919.1 long-chain fatty acid transport protein [Mesorhizobium sp. RMAD-H1]
MRGTTKTIVGAALIAAGTVGGAQAGGLERSSQDFDILFEPGTRIESGVTYVKPERKLKNIRGSAVGAATGGRNPANGFRPYETETGESRGYAVPKFSAKVDLTDDLACAGQYREPIGIHTDVGMGTVEMYTAIEQEITSRDYGLNCSYRFAAGEKGFFRILGGVSYQEVEGYQSRYLPAGFPTPFGATLPFRTGYLNVEDKGWGWRLGAAYEIPEYALRASLVYQSKIKYDLEGTITGLFPITIPVVGEAEVPDSVEFKFQTGIAPSWLAFGSVKWTHWSNQDAINFLNTSASLPGPFGAIPVGARITGLDLYYRDGWTVTGGVGHKLNDQWSVATSLTWDRGTSTGLQTQTDTWTLGLGTTYSPNERFEVRLAGLVGLLTSGTKDNRIIDGKPNLTGSVADFDDDFVGALSISAKLKF